MKAIDFAHGAQRNAGKASLPSGLLQSNQSSGIRNCVTGGDTSPIARPFGLPSPRPAASQAREPASPHGLRPLPHPCGKVTRLHQRPPSPRFSRHVGCRRNKWRDIASVMPVARLRLSPLLVQLTFGLFLLRHSEHRSGHRRQRASGRTVVVL
jgi:hypothetical protein